MSFNEWSLKSLWLVSALNGGSMGTKRSKYVVVHRDDDGRHVQIKATFKNSLTFRRVPDYYLGFKLLRMAVTRKSSTALAG